MEQGIIRYLHNVMNINSIEAFGNIRGSVHQDCRAVYFVRVLGIGTGYCEQIRKFDAAMLQNMHRGRVSYKRIKTLPGIREPDFYAGCYDKWQDSQGRCAETRAARRDTALPEVLGKALAETMEKYRLLKPGMSRTIEKNFAAKLMCWFDFVMEDFFAESSALSWNENSNMKLAVHNVVKEQEYLFYYMLTLVGVDVILLQSRADIELKPALKALSSELVLGSYGDIEAPDFPPADCGPAPQPDHAAGRPQRQEGAGNTTGSGKVRIVIPRRPERERAHVQPEPVQMPRRTVQNDTPAQNSTRTEKNFEQLALLASSVVMIIVHDNTGEPVGSGSGIMIGKKGYILTNSHVVSGGRFFTVRIEEDDKDYRTDEVIKYNQVFDLAVIRIERTLNPLPVYQGAQKLVRGQNVVAIGSPFGLFNSVSNGIIAGFRKIDDVDKIQFTAPISPGSSGGAVLNMYGEVIGIITSEIGDGQNISLATGYESIHMFIKGFV